MDLYRELDACAADNPALMALEIVFWVAAGLIVYAHLGYPLLLWALAAIFGEDGARGATGRPPGARDCGGRAPRGEPDHPRLRRGGGDRAEDRQRAGRSTIRPTASRSWSPRTARRDRTAELAREAGADQVLELPRGGKVAALNQAVARGERARSWPSRTPTATGARMPSAAWSSRFADGRVGYVCGQVRFEGGEGGNQEGLYWRYEMAVRSMETRLAGITAGNGGDLRGAPRGLHRARPEPRPGHRLPLRAHQAGLARRLRAGGGRRGEDGADGRGRVPPQAPDDVGSLGRDAAVGDARPARLRASSTRSRSIRTGCCAI